KRQITVALRRNMQDPEQVTSRAWMSLAFGDHPYALDPDGTVEGVTAVTVDDLRALHGRLFARDNLKIAVVGDIDAATLAAKLDETFGALPQASTLGEIPEAEVQAGPVRRVIPMDIPQAQIQFGHVGFKRHHPDFIAAYILNHILGGGGFSSRLTEEVREKRGLSYSVYSYLAPLDHAGLFIGGAATQNRRAAEALEVIQAEIERMAREGPTAEELEAAKTYLTGSYALRFDTSTKIAAQLLGIQLDDLGIDYVEKRNEMIEAVTLDDVRRVAAELLKPDLLLVTVVGQPAGIEDSSAIR